MANEHIINNTLIVTGSVTASQGFYGDGSGLTGITAVSEWDGSRDGDAEITGSLTVSGSTSVIDFTDTAAISGSIFSGSFVGDGSQLTGLIASAEWDGTRDGDAEITGSLVVSGSNPTIELQGDPTIDQNIEISNRNQNSDLAIGYQALPNSTSNSRHTIAIGCRAGFAQTAGTHNILIGERAGYTATNTSYSIAIGTDALLNSTGLDTGQPTTLSCNIAIGYQAGKGITTGWANVAVGVNALRSSVAGNGNVAVGVGAGSNIAGSSNVVFGKDAGRVAGGNNVVVGHQAGFATTGNSNVLIGYQSALSLTSGFNNVAIGVYSGRHASTISRCNVYIGPNAGPSTGTTQSNQLYIGSSAGETPLIRGDFFTGVVTINSCLKVAQASGSFIGDGSGLTNVAGAGFPYEGAGEITGSLIVSQSTETGTAFTIEKGHTILTQVSESLDFDDDTQAAAGGVPLGGLYRSGNLIAIRLT